MKLHLKKDLHNILNKTYTAINTPKVKYSSIVILKHCFQKIDINNYSYFKIEIVGD